MVDAAEPDGAAPEADAAADVAADDGAASLALGDAPPPLVQALARMAMAAAPTNHRARMDALIIRSPPCE
jgi:hypothetical protein